MYQAFDFMFQEVNNPILVVDKNNDCKKFNNAAKTLIGDCESFSITQCMDKDSMETWYEFSQKVMSTNCASCDINIHFPSQANSTVTHVKGHYNTDLQEIVLYITFPHKESNPLIGLSENEYETFFDFTKQGIIVSNDCGEILNLTSQVESFFSVKKEDLIGQNSKLLLDMFTDSHQEIDIFLERLKTSNKAEMVCRLGLEDGNQHYFDIMTMYNHIDQTYVTLIRDETEKHQLKKQVEHNSNLSVLGQMAASIAHEIRNPMTSLKGFTQLLNYTVTETGREYLKVIHSELNRMDDILNEFLLLSKPTERSIHFVSISDLLSQIVDFMYPQAMMQNTILQLEKCEPESDCILGDEKELKKVFMNIIKNGIEEMKDGGIITISQTLFKDNKVKISIKDTGQGMSQDQINKIFLPFFTTKTNGTGLGLAHVLRTVEDHNGYIEIESEIGHGTTFHLVLPLYRVDQLKENTEYVKNVTVQT